MLGGVGGSRSGGEIASQTLTMSRSIGASRPRAVAILTPRSAALDLLACFPRSRENVIRARTTKRSIFPPSLDAQHASPPGRPCSFCRERAGFPPKQGRNALRLRDGHVSREKKAREKIHGCTETALFRKVRDTLRIRRREERAGLTSAASVIQSSTTWFRGGLL